MNKKLVLLGAAAMLTVGVASAQKRVTGRVVDSQGEPVVGAAVRVEGAKGAVATDDNGRFILTNVPTSAKSLKITYIGKRARTVSISGNMSVTLEDDETLLDEAVVVGYGSARKVGTVVGSVTKVNSKDINDKPSTNISDALQGKISGMQVLGNTGDIGDLSEPPSITIRGVGSLGSGSTPLVVVDGSPADASVLNLLNANDIESVVTLKDASATSIYGSRAANGVIYITTKRGSADRTQVQISQKIGWSQLARSIGNPMNAAELLDFQLENGFISATDYVTYKSHGANTNWQDYYFRKDAPMYQTDFSVRGGSQTSSYFVSGSYLNNTGVDDVAKFNRYTLRTNLETKPTDWLSFGLNQSIIYTDRLSNGYTQNGSNQGSSYSNAAMIYPAYWDPFDPAARANHQILFMNSYDTKWLLEIQPTTINDIIYNGTGFIQLQPVKGLTLKSQLGVYATNTNLTGSVLTEWPGSEGKAQSTRRDVRDAQWTITNTAEYKFDLGEDHNFILLAGQEGIRYTSSGFGASATGSTDDRLLLLGNMTDVTIKNLSETKSEYQFLSFFGRLDYSLKNKYFANFTVRNDQSSRFGKSNRSAMFYSGGLMWNMKREYFMRGITWLDNFEVRASVGSTGNASIGNYTHLGVVGTGRYNGQIGWALTQPSNTELGWEKVIQSNFGFTATMFNRLSVEFNVYHRKTKDMLMEVPLPTTTGFSSQMLNIGEMSNRGIELEVDYSIIRTRDLNVSVRANYAYNKNRIDELFYGLEEWPIEASLINYKKGESLNFYMPIYAGVDKEDGAPMWYKKGHKGGVQHTFNPETMTKDASNMDALNQDTGKNYFAPHTGGFGLTASWKGLTLQADFAFVLGKYMVNNLYYWATSRGNLANGNNADRDMLRAWKQPGDITDIPSLKYDTEFDTHLLENASFLRLKNLTLAYDLPEKWMDATGFIKNVRLSFITRNLFTVTKFKGPDPEINTYIAAGNYPATRQFVLGLDVTF